MADPSPTTPPKINIPKRERPEPHDEVSSPMSAHEEGSHTSDEEYQHALEVVFDPENSHRRKSSLVTADTPAHMFARQKNTACFVHSLLEAERRQGTYHGSLDGIAETLGQNGQQKPMDPKGGESSSSSSSAAAWKDVVATKDHAATNGQSDVAVFDHESLGTGQPDEKQWTRRLSLHGQEHHDADPTATHSRLLTKKQLSDMAWGVRELSKRLGSIRLKLKVKTVFLLTKAHDESLIGNTRDVARWLLSPDREVRYTVYVEDKLRDNKKFDAKGIVDELERNSAAAAGADVGKEAFLKSASAQANGKVDRRLRYWNDEMCRSRPHTFDFVVTLGGDGTVLYASWLFQRIVPPVLSFALGSLGFLTKFDYEDFEGTLTRAFRDGVMVSLRLRFEGTVMRSQKRKRKALMNGEAGQDGQLPDGEEEEVRRDLVEELIGEEKDDEWTHKPDGTYEILNDIVVDRGPNPTMSSTEIFGDDEHFTSIQADGVCVATPTGSTAYNLAAGGSLCHPENPVILVTAICAHTLSFRPIILPDTIVLRVGVPYDARTSSWASFDGRERVELRPGDYVTISASRYPFANVMPQGRRSEDWVKSISGKLGWNTRQRQKSYKEWS